MKLKTVKTMAYNAWVQKLLWLGYFLRLCINQGEGEVCKESGHVNPKTASDPVLYVKQGGNFIFVLEHLTTDFWCLNCFLIKGHTHAGCLFKESFKYIYGTSTYLSS